MFNGDGVAANRELLPSNLSVELTIKAIFSTSCALFSHWIVEIHTFILNGEHNLYSSHSPALLLRRVVRRFVKDDQQRNVEKSYFLRYSLITRRRRLCIFRDDGNVMKFRSYFTFEPGHDVML